MSTFTAGRLSRCFVACVSVRARVLACVHARVRACIATSSCCLSSLPPAPGHTLWRVGRVPACMLELLAGRLYAVPAPHWLVCWCGLLACAVCMYWAGPKTTAVLCFHLVASHAGSVCALHLPGFLCLCILTMVLACLCLEFILLLSL